MNRENTGSDILIKVLATLGIIAIIVFVGWGTVALARRYAPNALSTVASAFVSLTSVFIPGDRVSVSLDPDTVASGGAFTVSFEHNKKTDGAYSLSYECKEEVFLKTSNGAVIFCNTPWTFPTDQQSVTFTAVSGKFASVSIPITVTFTPNDSSKKAVDGRATLDITNGGPGAVATSTPSVPASTSTPGTTTNPPRTPKPGSRIDTTYRFPGSPNPVSNPNGRIDLIGRILDVGIIDTNNTFIATTTFRSTNKIAVRFEVENVGDKTSPEWTFNAVLPTYPFHIFSSDTQTTLDPADKVQYTLGFDSATAGIKDFVVNVDPANEINESNEVNNITRVSLNIQ
jgi:hypothetical protein